MYINRGNETKNAHKTIVCVRRKHFLIALKAFENAAPPSWSQTQQEFYTSTLPLKMSPTNV